MPVYEHKLREELAKLNPKDRQDLLAHVRAKVSAGEMEIIPDPAASTREELQQPGFGELYGRPTPPDEPEREREPYGVPGAGFRVNRLSMGPGRPHPVEVPAAAAGMTATSIAAAPVAAARGVALGYTGGKAGQGVGRTAEMLGAPKGTARVGSVVGTLAGPAIGPRVITSALGAKGNLLQFLFRLGTAVSKEGGKRAAKEGGKKAAQAAARRVASTQMPKWVKRAGEKAQRAWLESHGKIPGTLSASDIAALKARGYTQEQIEHILTEAARPAKAPLWGQPMGSIAPTPAKAAQEVLQSPLVQEQVALVKGLAQTMTSKGNRAALKHAVKQMFGENWETVWKAAMDAL